MSQQIRISDEAYALIAENADKAGVKITAMVDQIVLDGPDREEPAPSDIEVKLDLILQALAVESVREHREEHRPIPEEVHQAAARVEPRGAQLRGYTYRNRAEALLYAKTVLPEYKEERVKLAQDPSTRAKLETEFDKLITEAWVEVQEIEA